MKDWLRSPQRKLPESGNALKSQLIAHNADSKRRFPSTLPRAGRFTVVPVSWQVAPLKRIVLQALSQELRTACGQPYAGTELTHLTQFGASIYSVQHLSLSTKLAAYVDNRASVGILLGLAQYFVCHGGRVAFTKRDVL